MIDVRSRRGFAGARSGHGQSIVEYALLLSLLAGALALTMALLGISVNDVYCSVARALGSDVMCGVYFSDGFDDLSDWLVDRGKWRVSDGLLIGGRGEGRIFRDVDADDYTITIDGANLANGQGYGVFFRTEPGPPMNGYSFQYDAGWGGGAFVMRKWVHGHELSPFAVARAPEFDWYGDDRQVQIVVDGDHFTAIIDGEIVLEGSDDTYGSGGIGLRTWGGSVVSFDGVVVTP